MRHFITYSVTALIALTGSAMASVETLQPMTVAENATSMESILGTPKTLFQLSYRDAEDAIGNALSQKGAGNKIAANIINRKKGPLFSYDKPITVEIHGLTYDKRITKWNANILFVAEGQVISAIPATGRYEEMVSVPMLKREVRSTDTITAEDIEVYDVPLSRTRTDTVLDVNALVGKSPLRNISSGRAIREHEIASPSLVKKNGIVQMRYRATGMEITATGQSLDDGAKGDVINVRNVVSRKMVRAIVVDSTTVDILGSNETTLSTAQPRNTLGAM